MKKHLRLHVPLSLLLFTSFHTHTDFKDQWRQAVQEYKQLTLNTEAARRDHDLLYQPFWLGVKQKIKAALAQEPHEKFLHHDAIRQTMVRSGYSKMQEYESLYLTRCISAQTQKTLSRFQETDFPGFSRECKDFNCSSNSLGHLFYIARIIEAEPEQYIDSVIELGGGYGNLMRIFKMINPQLTGVIIDLPEFLTLQAIFLRTTLPGVEVIFHTDIPGELKKGALHLVPVYFMDQIILKPDLFISTFAISEAPILIQKQVVEKNFFDAPTCYISGQLDGWDGKFVLHNDIMNGLRSCYSSVICNPFHDMAASEFRSYEAIAHRE